MWVVPDKLDRDTIGILKQEAVIAPPIACLHLALAQEWHLKRRQVPLHGIDVFARCDRQGDVRESNSLAVVLPVPMLFLDRAEDDNRIATIRQAAILALLE